MTFDVIMTCPAQLRYAYAVASALHDVRHILHKDFMIQVSIH